MDKIIKCPKCNKEIAELIHIQAGTQYWNFTVDKEGNPDYERNDLLPDGQTHDWECPVCEETLFTFEKDAVEFLRKKMRESDQLIQTINEIKTQHPEVEINTTGIPDTFAISQPNLIIHFFSLNVMKSMTEIISKHNLNGFIQCNEKTKKPEIIIY